MHAMTDIKKQFVLFQQVNFFNVAFEKKYRNLFSQKLCNAVHNG